MTNSELIQSVEADKPKVATNPIILIMGVAITLLVLIIAVLIWYILSASTTKEEDIVPTLTSTPEVTTTVTSTVTPAVSQLVEPTVTPSAVVVDEESGNFSTQPNWNAFNTSTAKIYGIKPERLLISEFKFRYPTGVSVAAQYNTGDSGVIVEIHGTPDMPTYLKAEGIAYSTGDQIKEAIKSRIQGHDCMPEMSQWEDKINFTYVKLGSYTWTKGSLAVTFTCPNDTLVSGNVEALGILSRKGQLLIVMNNRKPLDSNVLEILKTLEFIY